ncbi:hypothetical protein Pla110_10320 [Polystyrenella longa]|uniref:Uncharacterized protein n=1 Tax=Polystyrenella longa TaxID=2528007 RepID=A0A518CJG4_9PLAN|nr:hypothetical protein [Polystyrenella longa]QDU79324.1 hypothetical protein Pla110_10320 [Polystyrenella longa]
MTSETPLPNGDDTEASPMLIEVIATPVARIFNYSVMLGGIVVLFDNSIAVGIFAILVAQIANTLIDMKMTMNTNVKFG